MNAARKFYSHRYRTTVVGFQWEMWTLYTHNRRRKKIFNGKRYFFRSLALHIAEWKFQFLSPIAIASYDRKSIYCERCVPHTNSLPYQRWLSFTQHSIPQIFGPNLECQKRNVFFSVVVCSYFSVTAKRLEKKAAFKWMKHDAKHELKNHFFGPCNPRIWTCVSWVFHKF